MLRKWQKDMKTRKFEGKTEQEALEKVRDELGLSAIVLSIKKKQAKGLKGLFVKPTIVVTAAYDETEAKKDKVLAAAMEAANEARQNGRTESADVAHNKNAGMLDFLDDIDGIPPKRRNAIKAKQSTLAPPSTPPKSPAPPSPVVSHKPGNVSNKYNKDEKIANQQQTIQQLEEMLAKLTSQLSVTEQMSKGHTPQSYENSSIQMFYDSLVAQGVSPEIAEKVLEDANALGAAEKQDINLLVKIVYNKIIGILGEPRTLIGQKTGAGYAGASEVVVFMGPTGVGKTTTIAKLSSILLLNHHKQVGLITADTYRIAAVEQLRTYADIMGLNLKVIYSGAEILTNVERLEETHDVILVDTAGRSHHNRDNIKELKEMLELVPHSSRFLVLSVTTRQEDLLSIIKTYEKITDFDLIFTKLDETGSLGVLLNVCYLTGRSVSYVSFGQNVPEDIEKIQPDKIAKSLMGTGFDSSAWWGEA